MEEKLNEVKKALGMCYKQGLTSECTECRYREHNNVCMDALMEDALAVIKCLEEKQATSNESKWIPVTERLPNSGKIVLIYQENGYVSEGSYSAYDKKWRRFRWGSCYIDVTHWMPLPEPPKGE